MQHRGAFKRFGGLVLTFVVTLAAFPYVAPAPAFATTRPIFGIASSLGSVDSTTRERAYTMLEDAGASWARVGAYWPYADRNGKAARDWSTTDEHIAAAKRHNMTIVGAISGYAAWANGSKGDWYVPADPTEYANFVRDTVNRYKADVHYWEIWNEPNLNEFWAPTANPAGYAKLLRAAYLAVKQADPTAKVVFGGICRNHYGYLNSVYTALNAYPDAAANNNFFDILAVHPYADDRAPESTDPAQIWGGADRNFSGLPKMKQAMVAQGDIDKHIIVTEFGWVVTDISWTKGVGTALQADYLKRAYAMAQDWPWLDAMMWYGFKNWNNEEAPYSIVNTDLSPRPAYNAMKEAAAGGVTVTDPGTGGTTGGGTTGETTATAGGGTTTDTTTAGGSTTPTKTSSRLRPKKRIARAYTLNTLYASVSPDQAGRFVQVLKYSAGRWVRIKTAKLGSGSRYSYTYRTRRGAIVYRLKYLGSPVARPSVSPLTRVVAL